MEGKCKRYIVIYYSLLLSIMICENIKSGNDKTKEVGNGDQKKENIKM